MDILENLFHSISLVPWAGLCVLGGIALTRAAFRLNSDEEVLVGLTLGWIIQNLFANFVALIVPVPSAFWIASVLVFVSGAAALVFKKEWPLKKLSISPGRLLVFIFLVMLYFLISRGLAIFDDYAHLPTVSIMAAGDIPPHFSFDPNILYGYHHFLLLFSAQVMRLGNLTPWVALDVGRALTFGTAVMLAVIYTRRLTRSAVAGYLGGMIVAFGTGTRWVLLLLPNKMNDLLGKGLEMQGSGYASGPTLSQALAGPWAVEGMGSIPFPFAFANGIISPGVIAALGANGLMGVISLLLLLLTATRWRNWLGGVLTVILISVWGLLGEIDIPVILLGSGLVTFIYCIQNRTIRLPYQLRVWLVVVFCGCVLGLFSGGALTDIFFKTVTRLTTGSVEASYQTVKFVISWPVIVSSHLGVLSLSNPSQLLLAMLEMGPIFLVLPLLGIWGYKTFRLGRWLEAILICAGAISLLMVFVQFSGSTGVRNTTRLYFFIKLCLLFAVPLLWMWSKRRSQRLKILMGFLCFTVFVGGIVMGGISLVAGQNPVYSSYLNPLDAYMHAQYWNRLEPGAMVFDPVPERATALFGRSTNSSYTWYSYKPEWKTLFKDPDPILLRAAGYRYVYLDSSYWVSIGNVYQESLSGSCVRKIDKVMDEYSFRLLLDIGECQ